MAHKNSIRILHVIRRMGEGGAETWLMHILRHIDRERFHMDFLVATTQPGSHDNEICSLGSKLIPCLQPKHPLCYARSFRQALRAEAAYDIVHSHGHHYSGFVLMLAQQSGVPIRIAHSHTDTSVQQAQAKVLRRVYLGWMKRWVNRYATLGLGCSRLAAASLFGPDWETDKRWAVLYYGIDPDRFRIRTDTRAVRDEFGIPADAFVIGHVGRFVEPKNQQFLLDIVPEVIKHEPRTYLLLIGDGPLFPTIQRATIQKGLAERVIFAGLRSDVPRLMKGAMDILVLPSLYEGLPVVGLEAQAAGLPLVLSDTITSEIDIVHGLVHWCGLAQPISAWVDRIITARSDALTITQDKALTTMEKSSFNIQSGVRKLESLYANAL
jgi:glycosyltransferase involved in cell wall biosynthesis